MLSRIVVVLGFLPCWLAGSPPPTSARSFSELMDTMGSFEESRVLLTAVELDIFTAVASGATAAQVAARVSANPRATETLLNALAALGALSKSGQTFRNTPDTARYLVAGSPDYRRPALMHTVHMFRAWATLTDCVRAGTAVLRPGVDQQDQQWTESFIAAMHSGAQRTAQHLVQVVGVAGVRRLLDIGGGSGAYSIAFAKASPALHAEVLDLASVVPIARKHILEAGLADRISTRVGDLTVDDFGRDHDLILLSAICHMLDPEQNRDLFRRCYRALAPGGRIVIRDFILEPGKTAPKWVALFAINMLVSTKSGSTHTEAEYQSWLSGAGFQHFSRVEPAGDILVAARR
ncbi:MAG TPA: methyltransferase [Bryobacteraceae bacterium]|nr:methyltransferase [Bryobacteraceae bacterium]